MQEPHRLLVDEFSLTNNVIVILKIVAILYHFYFVFFAFIFGTFFSLM